MERGSPPRASARGPGDPTPDLIGTDRARGVLLDHLPSACDHTASPSAAPSTTPARRATWSVAGGLDAGLPGICVRPDLDTLTALPWEPGVATCLGNVTDPATGRPALKSPRDLLRSVVDRCARRPAPRRGTGLGTSCATRPPTPPQGWRRHSDAAGVVYTAGLRADGDNRPAAHPARCCATSTSASAAATTSSTARSSRST
ncbi:hypothetical protein [Streptomyces sp. KL116D]|uniref:hypothetical protein n=1 Tax=Streptomyces sp. KL116D TaxID=3045152 RepID=UPI0035561AFF